MRRQFGLAARCAVLRQIRRAGNVVKGNFGQRFDDEVFLRRTHHAQSQIVALRDQIGEAIFQIQGQLNQRVLRLKFCQ